MTDEKVVSELMEIEKKKGILMPEDVVEFAQDEETALHSKFEWDDGKAGQLYRIYQARQIIRLVIVDIAGKEQRGFVSLTTDRDDGGYRRMVHVLSDKEMREQLLADALKEMEIFKAKFGELRELARVFEEMEKVSRGRRKKTVKQLERSAVA